MRIGDQPVSSATIIAGLSAGANGDKLYYETTTDSFKMAYAAGYGVQARYTGLQVRSSGLIGFSSSNSADGAADVQLLRDAANVLAQRNGPNPQAFRLYNTFTDASNHERGELVWSGNVFNVGTSAAGTGANRTLRLNGSGTIIDLTSNDVQVRRDGTSSGTIFGVYSTGLTSTALLHSRFAPTINQASGTYTIVDINPIETGIGAGPHYLIRAGVGGSGNLWGLRNSGAMDLAEIADPAAPSANRGLVYMRDNGGGKTQLVARFPTGAVQIIATEP